ncbi:hypothetical protein ADUPG1_007099, partial [Aduncisulcus paluster]
ICGCDDEFSTIDAISEDIVCARPVPNRSDGPWTAVCSSHSYTTYMPDDSSMAPLGFTCTSVLDEVSVSCDGGCAYGQECRVSTESASAGMSFCADVIVDAGLRAVVSELVPAEYKEDGSGLFSVASLKNVEQVEGDESELLSLEYDASDISILYSNLTTIEGIEHIINLQKIRITNHPELTDISIIKTLSQLEYISFAGCDNDILNSIYLDLFLGLSHLNLSNTFISTLSADSFILEDISLMSLDNLEYFDISSDDQRCQLAALPRIPVINRLYLSGCSFVSDLSSDIFLSASVIDISYTSVSMIDIVSSVETTPSEKLINLYLDGCDLRSVSSQLQFFDVFPMLEVLSINNTGLPSILNIAFESILSLTLSELYADNNSWYNIYSIGTFSHLSRLSLANNFISDPSPLYSLPLLEDLDLSNNPICGNNVFETLQSNLSASLEILSFSVPELFQFGKDSSTIDLWHCPCSLNNSDGLGVEPQLSDNMVCATIMPDASSIYTITPDGESVVWNVVCASDSYSTYSSSESFTCTRSSSSFETLEASSCVEGCLFGYECRMNSESLTSSCVHVLPDISLKQCVIDSGLISSDWYIPSTLNLIDETEIALISVSALKSLSPNILEEGYQLSCSDTDYSIVDIQSLEHMCQVTFLDLSENSLSSSSSNLDLLGIMDNLNGLDISGNSGISDIPEMYQLESLSYLNVSNTQVTFPTSVWASRLLPQSLVVLDISSTNVGTYSFNQHIASRLPLLEEFYMNNTLIDDITHMSSSHQ